MCVCICVFRKGFFFQIRVTFSTKTFNKRATRRISRYQFATTLIVINHKVNEPYNESIDNVRTICLESVDRQMMDSTCVSSLVKK